MQTRTPTPKRMFSSAIGYILSALITFPVSFVLTLLTAQWEAGGIIYICFLGLTMTMFFAIAGGINRCILHRPVAGQDVRPVIDDAPSPSAASEAPGATDAASCLCAGRWEGGRFVLSASEIARVIHAPSSLGNVIRAATGNPYVTERKWFLVLGRGAAVFLNEQCDAIWSVLPDGVDVHGDLSARILSVDGRTETVYFSITGVPKTDMSPAVSCVCLLAWQSTDWADFASRTAGVKVWLSAWTRGKLSPWLLLFASPAQRDALPNWLRFRLPCDSIEDGWRKLCESGDDLRTVMARLGAKEFLRLAQDAPAECHVSIKRVLDEHWRGIEQQAAVCAIVLAVAALALGIWFFHSINPQERWMLILAVAGGVALIAAACAGVALYYAKKRRRGSLTFPPPTTGSPGVADQCTSTGPEHVGRPRDEARPRWRWGRYENLGAAVAFGLGIPFVLMPVSARMGGDQPVASLALSALGVGLLLIGALAGTVTKRLVLRLRGRTEGESGAAPRC